MPNNIFCAESAIVARLKAGAPGLKRVWGAGDCPGPEDSPRRPSAAVIHGGFEPMGRGPDGTLARQQWKIVLTVDCLNDPAGASARAQAGPLIGEILACLSGWRPTPDNTPLAPCNSPSADYQEGSARFYLYFTCGAVI